MKSKYYIGELAEYFGVSTDTLRLYDRVGILKAEKDTNGYRVYSREDMIYLGYVMRLRQLNIPLREIKLLVTGGSLERAEEVLGERETVLEREIGALQELLEVAKEYRAMFRITRESIGTFSVAQSPRIILREIGDSFINAASAFDRLGTHLVRRFTSLCDGRGLHSPSYSKEIYDPFVRKGMQRFAISVVDREGALEIPADCADLFTVLPPHKAVFSAAKCSVGRDYDQFVALHEYITAGGFSVTGDMVVIYVSMRNGANQSEDYYQIWVPVA